MDEAPRTFVQVWFERAQLRVMMRPEALKETVRAVVSKATARKILEHMESCEVDTEDQWKTRIDRNEKALEGRDPFELARIFKELSHLRAAGINLRAADRKHLQTAFDLLSDELGAALSLPQEQIDEEIRNHCGVTE